MQDRTCLDNLLTLTKGERQLDKELLVNWLYEGTVSTVPSNNVRRIDEIKIGIPRSESLRSSEKRCVRRRYSRHGAAS